MTRQQLVTMLILVTVICLGLAALLIPQRAARAIEPVPLLPFEPSRIDSVTVTDRDGAARRLQRLAPDRWEIQLAPNDAARNARWPAGTDRVRGFLRILDRLRGVPAQAESSDEPNVWVRIEDEAADGVSVGLPASSLGGRSVVQIRRDEEPGAAETLVTTDELSRLLLGSGVINWLDARAFAGVRGRTTEVAVTTPAAEMRVAHTGENWRILSPFSAPGETALIDELLTSLQLLPFTSPLPLAPGDVDESGSIATTTITITTERRTPGDDGQLRVARVGHTLRLVGPAGAAGQVRAEVFSADESQPGPTTVQSGPLSVEIDAERLASIVRQPQFYIARRTLGAPAGDIHEFVISPEEGAERRWARTPTVWAGAGGEASPEDTAALDGLARLLTETTAAVTAWVGEDAPPGSTPVASIESLVLGEAVLARTDLAVAERPDGADPGRAYAVLTTDGVARYYAPEAAVDVVRWIIQAAPEQ